MSSVFKPVGIIMGFVGGMIGRRIFARIWSLVDEEDAPEPKYRELALGKLVVALALEGAIARAVRGLIDHGTRHVFLRLTGEWPGEERPERTDD
jgi:hypothetical protein